MCEKVCYSNHSYKKRKDFKGLGIIYFVTHWVILVSVNGKSIHQSKQKPIIWRDRTDICRCRTDICSCRLSAKLFFMLGNSFSVPSLCKLNQISVCFIKISRKTTCKQLISFRECNVFFEVITGVLGRLVNFNIT